MSEYRKQVIFLKSLMMYADTEEHRALQERLCLAERNERCIGCACRLVGLIALLGLAGLGYSAVLLPEFFHNSTHVLIQFFSALGLGSMMCLAVFLGLWLWYRTAVNRIHDECRRLVGKMLESHFKIETRTFQPVLVADPHRHALSQRTGSQSVTTEIIALSKAS